ncbi:hypothetical protein HHI36_012821, partial [Cryptolaemus montrouzieri]
SSASESDDEDDGDLEERHIPVSSPDVLSSEQEACDLGRDGDFEKDNILLSQLAEYQYRSGTKRRTFPPPTSRTRTHTIVSRPPRSQRYCPKCYNCSRIVFVIF